MRDTGQISIKYNFFYLNFGSFSTFFLKSWFFFVLFFFLKNLKMFLFFDQKNAKTRSRTSSKWENTSTPLDFIKIEIKPWDPQLRSYRKKSQRGNIVVDAKETKKRGMEWFKTKKTKKSQFARSWIYFSKTVTHQQAALMCPSGAPHVRRFLFEYYYYYHQTFNTLLRVCNFPYSLGGGGGYSLFFFNKDLQKKNRKFSK